MKKMMIVLATGFEELEAITVVDVLRRANIHIDIVGLEDLNITGSHKITLQANKLLKDINVQDYDGVVLPGGLPGSETLANSKQVKIVLQDFAKAQKLVSAICAAPWALASAGVLQEKYTCYPSFEKKVALEGYQENQNVVVYKNTITSRGPATAMEFALALVKYLAGDEVFEQVSSGLLFKK